MSKSISVYINDEQTEMNLNKFVKHEDRSQSKAIIRLMEIAFKNPEVMKILETNKN